MHDCLFWPDAPWRCGNVQIFLIVFTVLSIVGCLLIIFVIILFKQYKYFVQRMILSLTTCACCKSIFFLIPTTQKKEVLCQTQGFFIQYFCWAELLWVSSITINIVLSLHKKSAATNEKYFHACVWCVSLFWTVVPLAADKFGPAGLWCWIDRDASATRFGTWYIPLFVILLFVIGTCVYIVYVAFCNRRDKSYDASDFEVESARSSLQEEVKPLIVYPVIYLLLNIPMTAYRIDDAVYPSESPSYTLLVLSVISVPLLGLFNAIAFSCFEDTFRLFTWSYVKSFCASLVSKENVRVTHNYQVADGDDASQTLLSDDANEHDDYGIHENVLSPSKV